jgi:predicted GTPase
MDSLFLRENKNHRENDIRAVIFSRQLLRPLDVLLIGSTGSGKSSTLNAVFGESIAKVGDGCEPETQLITPYLVHDYLRIHDSPGLGDGVVSDVEHSNRIREKLRAKCRVSNEEYRLIDLVLIIVDGGSRDLGTLYKILESVVLKEISPDRVVVAVNQADMAMRGRYWDCEKCQPSYELEAFLLNKVLSIQRRIMESTGLVISLPVCYSAYQNWNVNGLIDHIVGHIPSSRRSV